MIRTQVDVVKYGAAQKQFNIGHAVDFWFSVPPKSEQVQIVEYLRVALTVPDTAINIARREVTLLREYRTRLITDVVTGKLDVREAATRLPDEPDDPEPIDETESDVDTEVVAADETDEVLEAAEA